MSTQPAPPPPAEDDLVLARRLWARYQGGESMRRIAADVGLEPERVRDLINAVRPRPQRTAAQLEAIRRRRDDLVARGILIPATESKDLPLPVPQDLGVSLSDIVIADRR
jgi:hypothetical protein